MGTHSDARPFLCGVCGIFLHFCFINLYFFKYFVFLEFFRQSFEKSTMFKSTFIYSWSETYLWCLWKEFCKFIYLHDNVLMKVQYIHGISFFIFSGQHTFSWNTYQRKAWYLQLKMFLKFQIHIISKISNQIALKFFFCVIEISILYQI